MFRLRVRAVVALDAQWPTGTSAISDVARYMGMGRRMAARLCPADGLRAGPARRMGTAAPGRAPAALPDWMGILPTRAMRRS